MSTVLKARISGWGLLIGSIGLLVLTGTINWFYGDLLGVTTAGKLISSISSVAVDTMGLLFCGLAFGICLGIRKWGWAIVFFLAMTASAGWSINSMYSFQATERISASSTREAQAERIKDADKLQAASATKAMELAGRADTRKARRDFIDANQKSIADFRDSKVTVLIQPEPGAQAIANRLGWKLADVQFLQSGYLAILIIFLKMVGFSGSGFLLSWTPKPEPAKAAASEPPKSGSGPAGSGEPTKPRLVHSEPEPAAALRTKEAASAEATAKTEIVASEPASIPKAEPRKVSTVGSRVSTDGPTGKLTFEQFRDTIRHDMAHGEPASSTRALAAATGWSQSSVVRVQKKVSGRTNQYKSQPRRVPGNGASLHW